MAAGGVLFLNKYNEKKTAYDAALLSATEDNTVAHASYDAVSADTAEGQQFRADMVNARIAAGKEELASMQSEGEALQTEIKEKQNTLDELQSDEQNVYYQKVYDALSDAKAKVEGYLAGEKEGAVG